jgi:DNA repair protein RadC
VTLLDHLIIAKDGYYSFYRENYLKNAKKVAY